MLKVLVIMFMKRSKITLLYDNLHFLLIAVILLIQFIGSRIDKKRNRANANKEMKTA